MISDEVWHSQLSSCFHLQSQRGPIWQINSRCSVLPGLLWLYLGRSFKQWVYEVIWRHEAHENESMCGRYQWY